MTIGQLLSILRAQGLDVSPSRVDYAVRTGKVPPAPLDAAGCRVFSARHITAFVAYFMDPPRPGRRRRSTAVVEVC